MQKAPAISAELLASFLAEPVPRRFVAPEIRRAALRQKAPLAVAFIGGFFGCFGLMFVWAFTPWNLLQDLRLKNAPTVTGRVDSVSEANMSINKVVVMRYTFSFQAMGGRRQGDCFTTGRRWNEGDNVTVRFLHANPDISCIEGARLSAGSPFMFFTWIFSGIGFGLVAWVIIARRRTNWLLERGAVTEALVIGVERTGTQINKQYVHAITLERPGESPLVVRRHHPQVVAFARERLDSKEPVFLLYDPSNPKQVLLPETLG